VFVCGDSKKEEILTGNEVGSNGYSSAHYYVQNYYYKHSLLRAVFLRHFFLLVVCMVCILGVFTTII
jgi:hypothetical protein